MKFSPVYLNRCNIVIMFEDERLQPVSLNIEEVKKKNIKYKHDNKQRHATFLVHTSD